MKKKNLLSWKWEGIELQNSLLNCRCGNCYIVRRYEAQTLDSYIAPLAPSLINKEKRCLLLNHDCHSRRCLSLWGNQRTPPSRLDGGGSLSRSSCSYSFTLCSSLVFVSGLFEKLCSKSAIVEKREDMTQTFQCIYMRQKPVPLSFLSESLMELTTNPRD